MVYHEVYAADYHKKSLQTVSEQGLVISRILVIHSLATPSIPASKGVFSAIGTCTLDQSTPEKVWAAILDFSSYGKWNDFTPSIEPASPATSLEVGAMFKMQYRLTSSVPAAPIAIRIVQVDHESRTIAWRGCPKWIPAALLTPEKVQRVSVNSGGKTVFEVWETQAGVLAHAAKASVGNKLDGMNQGIADGLKRYMEGRSTS